MPPTTLWNTNFQHTVPKTPFTTSGTSPRPYKFIINYHTNDLKERTGYSHLKEEALDRTMWTARFGRGFGPVVRQSTK
jgi:hypothetical protein